MINWNKFWNYYEESSKKDYAKYKRAFMDAAQKVYSEWYDNAPRAVNNCTYGIYTKERYAEFSKKARVYMLSNSVPDAAAKALIASFKKWIGIMF